MTEFHTILVLSTCSLEARVFIYLFNSFHECLRQPDSIASQFSDNYMLDAINGHKEYISQRIQKKRKKKKKEQALETLISNLSICTSCLTVALSLK